MHELNEILKQALAVARAKPLEALDLLEAALEKARRIGDRRRMAILARHAGMVSAGSGDSLGAIKYYDEALRGDPEDAYLHFAIGDAYKTLGQNEQARFAFTRSFNLATEQGEVDVSKIALQALQLL
jgi:tetratricopeptide (TPR) repeat protein